MVKTVSFIENIFETLVSIIKIVLRSKFFNLKLPVASPNEEIVILGNGPSLKTTIEEHGDFIANKKKLGVNYFALSDYYERLKPEYYVIADPSYWLKEAIARTTELRQKLAGALLQKTSWPINFLIPFEAKNTDFVKKIKENTHIAVYYFNKTTVKGFPTFCNLIFNWRWGMPRPQNVLAPSLITTLNMGFQKIYVIGADHSWHETFYVNEDNVLCMKMEHFTTFYKNDTVHTPIEDIFTGRYVHLHEQFESLAITFRNYFLIRAYADYKKAKIYNASVKSYIDAFERLHLSNE